MNPIEMKLVVTNVITRWHCDVCGGATEKVSVLCEGKADCGCCIRVCERCLEAGNIDSQLQEHARALSVRAEWLRSIVGRLHTPSFAEWKAAEDAQNAKYAKWFTF